MAVNSPSVSESEQPGVVSFGAGGWRPRLLCCCDGLRVAGRGRTAEVLRRSPVTDTDVKCPVCGALAWDAIEMRTEPDEECYRLRGLVVPAVNPVRV